LCFWTALLPGYNVLGSPRKSLVDRRRGVFGTTVDRVLRRAPCRVMIAAATNGGRA